MCRRQEDHEIEAEKKCHWFKNSIGKAHFIGESMKHLESQTLLEIVCIYFLKNTLDNCLAISTEAEHKYLTQSRSLVLGIYPKEISSEQ
jgi:hypothetical protein